MLVARLAERRVISQELARKLLSWTRRGLSAFAGEPIPPGDTRTLEDMASCLSPAGAHGKSGRLLPAGFVEVGERGSPCVRSEGPWARSKCDGARGEWRLRRASATWWFPRSRPPAGGL